MLNSCFLFFFFFKTSVWCHITIIAVIITHNHYSLNSKGQRERESGKWLWTKLNEDLYKHYKLTSGKRKKKDMYYMNPLRETCYLKISVRWSVQADIGCNANPKVKFLQPSDCLALPLSTFLHLMRELLSFEMAWLFIAFETPQAL